MGTPKLTLADLLALRDREAPPAGVELALAADATAQLALLAQHRILVLIFTKKHSLQVSKNTTKV